MRSLRSSVGLLGAVVLAAGALVGCGGSDQPEAAPSHSSSAPESATSGQSSSSSSSPSSTGGGLDSYYQQKLSWKPCKQGSSLQCTTLRVPLDYRHPGRKSIGLAVLKDPADEPSRRIGSMVVNPGGPGAPGTTYASAGGFAWGAPLREAYDIVGFNPRGTVHSAAVDCLSDDELDHYINVDPTPDDRGEVKEFLGASREMAKGCRSGDNISAHVSTVEAARDMDILRQALGEKKLTYFGASYGTKLGSTYASLFPQKSGRLVLDGAMPPGLDNLELNLAQAKGFEVALRSYLRHCVAQGSCFLGDSVAAGLHTITGLLARIDKKPIRVGDRELTSGGALYGLIMPLYSRDYWYLLDNALKGALAGNGKGLLDLADMYSSRQGDHYTDNSVEANWAINCLDDPEARTPAEVRKLMPRFDKASPTFGDALAWMTAGCVGQTLKPVEKAPKIEAKGADPILVIGTTRDPATPYPWAKQLAAALDSGVLISRDGDGHGGYHAGSPCVDDAVEAYLVKGTVPRDGLSC